MEVFGLIWVFNGMEFSNENNQKKLFLNISLYTRMASISASATKKKELQKLNLERSWHPKNMFCNI